MAATEDKPEVLDARLQKGMEQLEMMERGVDFSMCEGKGNWALAWWAYLHNGIRLELQDMYHAVTGLRRMKKDATDELIRAFFEWFKHFERVFIQHLEFEEMNVFPNLKSKIQPRPKSLPSEDDHIQVGLKLNKVRAVEALVGAKKPHKVASELERVSTNFLLLALDNLRSEERNEAMLLFHHGKEDEDLKRLEKCLQEFYGKDIGLVNFLGDKAMADGVEKKRSGGMLGKMKTNMALKTAEKQYDKQRAGILPLIEAFSKYPPVVDKEDEILSE
ncbi:hypothetical protein FVE85_8985 [Porphyridium purpureum]|uniref:Uncharacterized protein n=1 Tax=Porphyridium purpureum TaxID=35688 RepID=A0A5J4YPR8_PORPP|nr:hypothetical protein FVE85_8985 [Porphyridium purpureum]|eukprot:POR3095..scf222_8